MEQGSERILKVDERGRVWTPRELREAVLDEFERSGMSGTQFARQIGVKYPTFAGWVQQRREERGGQKRLGWVEATVAAKEAPGSTGLSVHLPGGARMEIVDEGQARVAACLLWELAKGEAKEGAQC